MGAQWGPGGFPFPFEIAFPTLKYNFGGFTLGNPTGGDMGAGTINVGVGLFVNGQSYSPRIQQDIFTISTLNTIPQLTQAPSNLFLLFVSGQLIEPTAYSIVSKTVNWLSSTQGLYPGDRVVCVYTY